MVLIRRKTNLFEKLILLIGLIIVVGGLYLVTRISQLQNGITSDTFMAILLWLVLLFVVIIAAVSENAREDLSLLVHENSQEVRLLRQISHEQTQELRILRQHLEKRK